MKLYNLDHVGIAVKDLDAAIEGYLDRYGVKPIHRQVVAEQGVEEAMIPVGGSFVQLLGAISSDSPVGRFLQRNGEGLHHVAYAVLDIEEALAHLVTKGARLIDETRELAEAVLALRSSTLPIWGVLSSNWWSIPMAEFEIRGGAGPYEAAAIIAVFDRLLAEAAAARAERPGPPRLPAWVRAYQGIDPEDPMPRVLPEQRGGPR